MILMREIDPSADVHIYVVRENNVFGILKLYGTNVCRNSKEKTHTYQLRDEWMNGHEKECVMIINNNI